MEFDAPLVADGASPGERRIRFGAYTVRIVPGDSPARSALEAAVLAAGVPLALLHRRVWPAGARAARSWFLIVEASGRPEYALAVHETRSRSLPLHTIARVERFGFHGTPAVWEAALHGLAALATAHARILRLHVEVFTPEAADRQAIAAAAGRLGYCAASAPRCYDRTLLMDLTSDETAIFAGIHATARRYIRVVRKHPVEVRTIPPAGFEARMDELLAGTLARTGGEPQPHDWRRILEMSQAVPAVSRVVGLFRTDTAGPQALLAFAWGCHHGPHAQYATAASARPADLRISLAYALAWDLIMWSRAGGAQYFDFGGVSPGSHGGSDRLGGISDFKRYFTKHEATVGEEWVLEPRPLRSALSRRATAINVRLRNLTRR